MRTFLLCCTQVLYQGTALAVPQAHNRSGFSP